MKMIFDEYTYKTRIMPAALVSSPFIALATIALQRYSLLNVLGGAFGIGACSTLLFSQLGRDLGKKKEPALFLSWSGTPTTLMLSHTHTSLDKITLSRYHKKLQSIIPSIIMPSSEEEQKNWAHASEIYESCIIYLREKTRDQNVFPLVFAENINYGFRRNFWAMKPAGFVIALLGIVISTMGVLFSFTAILTLLFSVILLTLWIFRITPSWVKLAADAYARALLATLDQL